MQEDWLFIENQQDLDAYCAQCMACDVIAVDTEFMRQHHFYPKAGLFQINNGENIALIDPLTITNWQALTQVFCSKDIVKVFHACDEDIELLIYFLGQAPENVFDTQFAAALCNMGHSLSYQALVRDVLAIEVEKDHRRSDWMARPLTAQQCLYAANDVRYLLDVYTFLHARLTAPKAAILAAHIVEIAENVQSEDYAHLVYRIGDAWRLDALQFAKLRELVIWRELTMRQRNTPRSRLAKDDVLINLAKTSIQTAQDLAQIDGLPSFVVRDYAEQLIALLNTVPLSASKQEIMLRPKKDKLSSQLKKHLKQQALVLNIDERLLIKKLYSRLAVQALRNKSLVLPALITGWRRAYYEKAFEDVTAGSVKSDE